MSEDHGVNAKNWNTFPPWISFSWTSLSAVPISRGSFQAGNGMKVFHLYIESGHSMANQFLVTLTSTGVMKKT